jgi:hypothetical protein
MLEHTTLLVRRATGGWDILESETNRLLGIARIRPTRSSWGLGWLTQITFDVFESEDEPLVFTVRRLWGFSRRWEICDADGHRVARVRRGWILDAFGRKWASLEWTTSGFRIHAGDREFARTHMTADGLEICFAPDLKDHPLTKMSLLGAVLAQV